MELIKSFRQESGGRTLSELNIVVEYDASTNTVTEFKRVSSWNELRRTATDLTTIFAGDLSTHLDKIIEEIDWREVYATKYATV